MKQQLLGISLMSIGYVFHIADTISNQRSIDAITWILGVFTWVGGALIIVSITNQKKEE